VQATLCLGLVGRPPSGPLALANPLCRWGFQDVKDYIEMAGVPYNPLLDQGYKSIGDRLDQAGRVDLDRFERGAVGALGSSTTGDDSLDVEFLVRTACRLNLDEVVVRSRSTRPA
jgi:hypothetical protein